MKSKVNRIIKLQSKAFRIINFAHYHAPSSPLNKTSQILKLTDIIKLQNFLYVYDSFSSNIPSSLRNTFSFVNTRHGHHTRINQQKCVNLPISKTIEYGINSICGQSARIWNSLQVTLFKDVGMFPQQTRNKYKQNIISHFMKSY